MRLDEDAVAALAAMTEAGTRKRFNVLAAPQGVRTRLADGQELLVACSNDYLGMANDPAVVAAGIAALQEYGAGTASVRFICGTFAPHLALEADLAEFVGTAAAVSYVSCWDANAAAITVLADAATVVLSDELNHASIVDAIRLSRAGGKVVYPHSDLAALEDGLRASSSAGRRLVVTDGVFSMEGDLARLPEIVALCRRYDAALLVDDSHGLGVMGPEGRGTASALDVHGQIDVVTGTLGKALGGAAGGFVAASEPVVALLSQLARPGLFSNALPVTVAASARAALSVLRSDAARVRRLHQIADRMRSGLRDAGLRPLDSASAIVPIIVGDTATAIRMSQALRDDHGVLVTGFGYPVVPEGTARLRLQASSAFTDDDADAVVTAVAAVA